MIWLISSWSFVIPWDPLTNPKHHGSHLLPIGDVYSQVDITKASRADLSDEAIFAPDDELTAGGGWGGGHARLFLVRHLKARRDQAARAAQEAGRACWLCVFVILSLAPAADPAGKARSARSTGSWLLEASEEATRTLERRARGPTPDPGYHAPLKQGDGVKLGLEQGGGGLERCWCGSEPGGHLVPSSSAGQPSAPSRPPISWPPNSTCPWWPTWELSIDARTHTTHTTHIRSTLHYLHSIRFDLNGWVTRVWLSSSAAPWLIHCKLVWLICTFWIDKDGRSGAAADCQLGRKPGGRGNKSQKVELALSNSLCCARSNTCLKSLTKYGIEKFFCFCHHHCPPPLIYIATARCRHQLTDYKIKVDRMNIFRVLSLLSRLLCWKNLRHFM